MKGHDNEAFREEEEEEEEEDEANESTNYEDEDGVKSHKRGGSGDPPEASETSDKYKKQDSVPLLFGAINSGNYEAVESLLSHTADFLNSSTYGGLTPLHAACHMQHLDILKLLISYGAKANCFDSLGNTALHVAVNGKWYDGIAELLQQGASPTKMSHPPLGVHGVLRESPLHIAVRTGDKTATNLLLKYQSDLCMRDSKNFTVFHLAAFKRNSQILRQLLEEGDNINFSNDVANDGFTLFHAALSKENPVKNEPQVLRVVQTIHDVCDNINQVNFNGETPVLLACQLGLPTVVKYLIANGGDPTQVTREGQTVLHAACTSGCSITLQHLFATGRVGHLISCRDNNGFHPFYFAVESGSVECCKILLDNGEHLTNLCGDDITNCALIIDKLPSAFELFKHLFDSGVTLSKKPQHDPDFNIVFNYSVLMSSEKGRMQCSIISELADTPFESLIKHPLLESFLYLKWCRIRRIFYLNVIEFFIYLIIHTTFVMYTFGSDRIDWAENPTGLSAFKAFHVIFLLIIFVPGMLVTFANYKKYLLQWETYTRLLAMVCSAIIIFMTDPESQEISFGCCASSDDNTTDAQKIANLNCSSSLMDIVTVSRNNLRDTRPTISTERAIASLSVFFGWVELMMLLGRFPSLGAYILMFTKVAKSVIKFLLSFLSLLIGFSLSFHILFLQMPVFADHKLSFAKTLMMMTGEIAYSEFVNEECMPFSTFSLTALSVFLFMVTVIMSNLLIGLAVNDIPDLKRQGKIKRLVKQASYLMAYEKLVLFTYNMKFFPRRLRKFLSERCNIKSLMTIWPNKEMKRNKYRQTIPNETMKEAVTLGNCEHPEDFTTPTEDDVTDQLRAFRISYSSDRRTQRHKFSDLNVVCNNIQKQIDVLHLKVEKQMSHMSMQLQQQLQQNENFYNIISQIQSKKNSQ